MKLPVFAKNGSFYNQTRKLLGLNRHIGKFAKVFFL
jgi:hypothetical protein